MTSINQQKFKGMKNSNGYILEIITSNNNNDGCCNEIINVYGCEIESNGDIIQSKLNTNFYIENKYPLSLGTELYCGITGQYLAKSSENKQNGLSRLVQILNEVVDRNLYLIGWNVSEHVLDILEANLKHFNVNIDISYIRKNIKIIDIQRSSNKLIDSCKLYGSLLTLENVAYFYKKAIGLNCYEFQKNIINQRSSPNTCSETLISLIKCCLLAQMKQLQCNDLDGFKSYVDKPSVLKTMPFGKYKGKNIDDIAKTDIGYLNWLSSQIDISTKYPDLKHTITSILNADIE